MDDHSPSSIAPEPSPASWAVPASTGGNAALVTPVASPAQAATNGTAIVSARPVGPELVVGAAHPASAGERVGSEQLARIEDKTSRIEEKFARSEAAMQRVVDRFDSASGRMSEVASQAELAAVRGEVAYIARRVRALPGTGALAITAIATAVLTAIVTIAILKYVPGLLAR